MPSRKVVPISSPPSTPGRSKSIGSPKQIQKLPPIQPYKEIVVQKLLSKAKFPVFLASCAFTGQSFALKIFQFEDNQPHPYFRNEARFSGLDHPNIIRIIHAQESTSLTFKQEEKQVSSVLIEYAPYGDFFDFVKKVKYNIDEKLARTYFHQLIDGIEYLHKNNVIHLDIKLENLLIGDDYQLKIADFDLSHVKGDPDTFTTGTRYYRAPELQAGSKQISEATDIYSAGVILFVLKCGGVLPHLEDESCKGVNLRDLMAEDPVEFFATHCYVQGRKSAFFSSSFKELFMSMVSSDPEERISIKEIKKSKWYRGPVYTQKELVKVMKNLLTN